MSSALEARPALGSRFSGTDLGRNTQEMIRKARIADEIVRASEMGGRMSKGGSGCDARIHLAQSDVSTYRVGWLAYLIPVGRGVNRTMTQPVVRISLDCLHASDPSPNESSRPEVLVSVASQGPTSVN